MPIEVVVNPGPTEKRYRTSVIYVKGSQFVVQGDNGSGSGNDGITLIPGLSRIILVTIDAQPDNEIAPGHFGKVLPLDMEGVITRVRMTTDIDCDVEVAIWKDDIANGDPTIADDITGGGNVVMTGARYIDVDITGWALAVATDDVWWVEVVTIDDSVRFLQVQIEVAAI